MQKRLGGPPGAVAATASIAVLAGMLSACSLGGGQPSALEPARDELPGISGRDCRLASPGDALPTFGELARSGTRGNVALWGREMDAADTVELSVRYGEDGRLLWVETIRSTVSGGRALALESLFLEALDEREQPDWGVRVLVVGGEVDRLAPSVICDPEPRSIGSGLYDVTVSSDFRSLPGYRFPVRIALDERGNLLDIQLLRRTYSRAIDQFLINYIRSISFEPGLHDGIGRPSILDLDLEVPRRPR